MVNRSAFFKFLKAPELKLPVEEFPFAAFSTSEMAVDGSSFWFPAHMMLGKQAEFLFEHWLKYSPHFQLLAANIQIQGATETLGELDYIIQEKKTDETTHVELACKFYLLDPTLGDTISDQWIGPNRKDRLVDKLEKMRTKQFPLLQCAETASTLSELQLDVQNIGQRYCLKAFLFVQKGCPLPELPKHFQDCVTGYYISWDQLDAEGDAAAVYALPKKKEWLLPSENLQTWLSFSEAKAHIENAIAEKRSPLVYKNTQGSVAKFFVVWW